MRPRSRSEDNLGIGCFALTDAFARIVTINPFRAITRIAPTTAFVEMKSGSEFNSEPLPGLSEGETYSLKMLMALSLRIFFLLSSLSGSSTNSFLQRVSPKPLVAQNTLARPIGPSMKSTVGLWRPDG